MTSNISNTNNFSADIWFQVFLFITNNFSVVMWFQVFLFNTNNFEIDLFDSLTRLKLVLPHQVGLEVIATKR